MVRRAVLIVGRERRGKYGAGQWKDIAGFCELVRRLGVALEVLEHEGQQHDGVVGRCESLAATDIILYYSFLPELLISLRRAMPTAKLYVRTVNAEAFQHWQRARVGFVPTYENIRQIYGSLRLGWRDAMCKWHADALLGISEWDNRVYWRHLPGRAEVADIPYQCPWPHIRPQVSPLEWGSRRSEIVCLAGARDAIGRAMVDGFSRMTDALGGSSEFKGWKFRLSPGLLGGEGVPDLSQRVERMTELDEPWDLLCSAKALAVLTPLGFGTKTTIIDALAAGCHVLVHPVLAGRLPEYVRTACIEYSEKYERNPESLAAMLATPPLGSPIPALKATAESGLARAFGIGEAHSDA